MFRVTICDDNRIYAEYEKELVKGILDELGIVSRSITIFENGQEILCNPKMLLDCNLLLMDVEMQGKNGIEVLREIERHQHLAIAIVSSFIDYAPEGYKVNAFRYLLKSSVNLSEGLREVVEYAAEIAKVREEQKITLEFREKRLSFSIDDLIYVESKLHYTYFHIMDVGETNTYSLRNTLDVVEQKLNNKKFIRIHKSQLVNAQYITDVRRYEVVLNTDKVLTVAQGKYDEVMLKYARYIGEGND